MYKADFGGGNRTIDLNVATLALFMQHSFKLGKKAGPELSGFTILQQYGRVLLKAKPYGAPMPEYQNLYLKQGKYKGIVHRYVPPLKFKGSANFAYQQSVFLVMATGSLK